MLLIMTTDSPAPVRQATGERWLGPIPTGFMAQAGHG
jgi:hypothetical protein